MGVRLEHTALVPCPGEKWPVVVASLIDGVDLLLLGPGVKVRGAEARKLSARARERGVVMILLGVSRWPDAPDIHLEICASRWDGLGSGHGRLVSRRVEVASTGRRAAARQRRLSIWLPSPDGEVRACADAASGVVGEDGTPAGWLAPATEAPTLVGPVAMPVAG
jgi:hypothetical protein